MFVFPFGVNNNYNIKNSMALDAANAQYLARAFVADANKRKGTLSVWVQRSPGITTCLLQAGTSETEQSWTGFTSIDTLRFYSYTGSTNIGWVDTLALFRDPTAWYHVVVNFDYDNVDPNSRVLMYVNNVLQAVSTTNTITTSANHAIGSAVVHLIGAIIHPYYSSGIYADHIYVSGQCLPPPSFGTYSATTGQWVPKRYLAAFGTNGHHQEYRNATSLGLDTSGNGNSWASTNLQAAYNQLLNTPTNVTSMLSPIDCGPNIALYSGIYAYTTVGSWSSVRSTMGLPSGKWYWECNSSDIQHAMVGIMQYGLPLTSHMGQPGGYGYAASDGQTYNNYLANTYGATWGIGDIIGVAFDVDAGTLTFYKNNVSQGVAFAGLTGLYTPTVSTYMGNVNNSIVVGINQGQHPFIYTPPAGFKAPYLKNLPAPLIVRPEKYVKALTYKGNGANLQVGEIQKAIDLVTIPYSLLFDNSLTQYLSKTMTASRNAMSFSVWVKRGRLGVVGPIFFTYYDSTTYDSFHFLNTGVLRLLFVSSGTTYIDVRTTAVFRDPSMWLHIELKCDGSQTSGSRWTLTVNGVQLAFTGTDNNNSILWGDSSSAHYIGYDRNYGSFDGSMATFEFVNSVMPASNFGQFDGNNYWVSKTYGGAYGTPGFRLDFSGATDAILTNDVSGQGNHWTKNGGITVVANQLTDTPTNNFSTLNPLWGSSGAVAYSKGNTKATPVAVAYDSFTSCLAFPSALFWYAEATVASSPCFGNNNSVGIIQASVGSLTSHLGATSSSYGYMDQGGLRNNGATAQTVTAYTTGDVIMIAVGNGCIWWGKNGVWLGTGTPNPATGTNPAYSGITGDYYFGGCDYPSAPDGGTTQWSFNFGQRPFTYTPPTGFKSLCENNIPEYLYDEEYPDFAWIKSRSTATDHMLFDSVRGVKKSLSSNTAGAQVTDENSLIQFNKNGLYIGNNANINTMNASYMAWCFKKSPMCGIDIVSFTGTGAAGQLQSHSLGVVPSVILYKSLAGGSGVFGHKMMNSGSSPWSYCIYLELVNGQAATANAFNNTAPTSTQFTVGIFAGSGVAQIAYLFAEVPGFSKFGSFTGNGLADGTFIYCGFKPAIIMIKRVDTTGSWDMKDNKRSPYNPELSDLFADLTQAEYVTAGQLDTDFIANGFKLRATNVNMNASGGIYIFMAFAESPFQYTTAR